VIRMEKLSRKTVNNSATAEELSSQQSALRKFITMIELIELIEVNDDYIPGIH
jgi:hypothetical protein